MEVILPGGLPLNGRIEQLAKFRSLTGRIEQSLMESAPRSDRTGYVTAVLSAVLESIGDQPSSVEQIEDLCVADRQYLMLRLAASLDGEQVWLKLRCGGCDALFDVEIQRCDLPIKEAGSGYPSTPITLGNIIFDLRLPNGRDQQQINKLDENEAMRLLLKKCLSSVEGEPVEDDFLNSLSESQIEAIDEALDELSPAVCTQLLVHCPECKLEQRAELDHYALSGMDNRYFHDEVHTLASHYHWSEAEILDLPQSRRRLYLDMINRSHGMSR